MQEYIYHVNHKHKKTVIILVTMITSFCLASLFDSLPITSISFLILLFITSYKQLNNKIKQLKYCKQRGFLVVSAGITIGVEISHISLNRFYYFITYNSNRNWLIIFQPKPNPINIYLALNSKSKSF